MGKVHNGISEFEKIHQLIGMFNWKEVNCFCSCCFLQSRQIPAAKGWQSHVFLCSWKARHSSSSIALQKQKHHQFEGIWKAFDLIYCINLCSIPSCNQIHPSISSPSFFSISLSWVVVFWMLLRSLKAHEDFCPAKTHQSNQILTHWLHFRRSPFLRQKTSSTWGFLEDRWYSIGFGTNLFTSTPKLSSALSETLAASSEN